MFGGIKELIAWNKLGLQLRALRNAWQEWVKMQPNTWGAIALNVLKHFLLTCLSVAVSAVIAHWASGTALADFLTSHFGLAVSAAATPIVKAGFVFADKLRVKYFTEA